MPLLTPNAPGNSNLAVTPTIANANSGGDLIPNPKGNVLVRLANGSGGDITVTFAVGPSAERPGDATYPKMTLSNLQVVVPAGGAKLVGPLPKVYNNTSNQVAATYSSHTSLTLEVIQV